MCVCVCVDLGIPISAVLLLFRVLSQVGGVRPGMLGVGSQPEAPQHWQIEHQVLAGQVVPLRKAFTPFPPALLNSYSPSWPGSREQVEMGPSACQVLELPIHCFLLPCHKVPTFPSFYPHLPHLHLFAQFLHIYSLSVSGALQQELFIFCSRFHLHCCVCYAKIRGRREGLDGTQRDHLPNMHPQLKTYTHTHSLVQFKEEVVCS